MGSLDKAKDLLTRNVDKVGMASEKAGGFVDSAAPGVWQN